MFYKSNLHVSGQAIVSVLLATVISSAVMASPSPSTVISESGSRAASATHDADANQVTETLKKVAVLPLNTAVDMQCTGPFNCSGVVIGR